MSGNTWYSLPARLFREGAEDRMIAASINAVGKKPISDGAATDKQGNHYFTNVTEHAITRLGADGNLTHLIQDEKLRWPDNVYLARNGWYYVSVNELNTTPAFTGGKDEGKAPYYIYRFKPIK